MHVVTLGSAQRQLEIWIDPDTAGFIFRLVKEPQGTGEVLNETILPHMLCDRWQHYAFSVQEQVLGKRQAMTVSTTNIYIAPAYH